jgi:hypothetical protein
MADVPHDEPAAAGPTTAEPDNVLPFPRAAKPVTGADVLARLDRVDANVTKTDKKISDVAAMVEPVVSWVAMQRDQVPLETVLAKAVAAAAISWADAARTRECEAEGRAREREQQNRGRAEELRRQLAELAGRVELLEHPNRDVAEVAAEAATGDPDAIDDLASRLQQQPSWWARHRGWIVPLGLTVLVALAIYVAGKTLSRRERRRIEAEQRRALEQRVRQVEANYMLLHGAYTQQQHALAAEQQRPLFAGYDQRSFPVYQFHEHDHHHEHHAHETVVEVDASDVASELAPHLPRPEDIAQRVAGLLPGTTTTTIVQPARHTRERIVREKVRIVRVPTCNDASARARAAAERAERAQKAAAKERRSAAAERRAAERARQLTQRDLRAGSLDAGAAIACAPSRVLEEAIAQRKRRRQ